MGVPAIDTRVELRGRGPELAALERVLATARSGRSAVLVLRGEAGIGKTALLEYAASRAVGFRTAGVAGIDSEMGLPFAGLHQFCAPMLGQLPELPGPQRCVVRRVRTTRGRGAQPVSGRPGGAQSAGLRRRGSAAGLPRR